MYKVWLYLFSVDTCDILSQVYIFSIMFDDCGTRNGVRYGVLAVLVAKGVEL